MQLSSWRPSGTWSEKKIEGETLPSLLARSPHFLLFSFPPIPQNRRYETFWLPLIAVADNAEYRVADLVPPLDIAWVWYIHRLNPTAYKNDLLQAFKFVPAPSHTPGPNNPRALPRLNLSDAQFMALVQQTEVR